MKNQHKLNKYADAVFNVTDKFQADNKEVLKNLSLFSYLMRNVPQLRYLLLSRRVDLNKKLKIIDNVFETIFGKIEMQIIHLLLKNGDILLFPNLSEHLLKKQKLLQNTQKVSIIFSKDYDQDYKNEILESVQKKFKIQDLSEISFSRDSDIIGGVKIRVGDKIIDGSIAARINKIKESLISI